MTALLSCRIPGVLGEWELRASARGLTRVIVPTRLDLFRPLPGVLSSLDEASVAAARDHLDLAAQEFAAYFAGDFRTFSVALDRPEASSSFTDRVHHALSEIPWGQTMSYSAVAAMVGSPRAVRAVGTACGRNPLPLIVPCHRVTRTDGSLGMYTGGAEFKRALLALEGVEVV